MVAELRGRWAVGQQKRGKPRRYRICVLGGLPDDIGQRVAELHAAAVLATTARPRPPSRDDQEGTSNGRRARTEEEDS